MPVNAKGDAARLVTGVLAGVAAAMVVIVLAEMLNGILFPMPTIDPNNVEAVARLVAAMPAAAQAMVVGGWLVGALVGAALAVAIGRRAWAGWFPAGSVLVGGLFNALFISHPWWMDVGALVAPLLGGALGIALTRRHAIAPSARARP